MKKGFTNLMSSIDSALKPSPDDMSDTMSVRSDASSDSEKFVLINCEADIPGMDLMFLVNEFTYEEKVEEASEVLEEDSTLTSTSEHSLASSGKRKDLVGIQYFEIFHTKTIHFLSGFCFYFQAEQSGTSSAIFRVFLFDKGAGWNNVL